MKFQAFYDSPFVLKFSFEKLIRKMEAEASESSQYALSHQRILDKTKEFPELLNGISNLDFFKHNETMMKELLRDLFPPMLTGNEIKAIGFPFYNFFFNPSKRFQSILKNAGENFDLFIKGLDPHRFYVMSCCLILRDFYKVPLNMSMPFIFDIPNEEGIVNHYRFLNNVDFVDINPLEEYRNLTEEEIGELLDNFDDYELWKEKFPPKSWELKGFAVVNFFDATTEIAVSNLKSKLINLEDDKNLKSEMNKIFRSIFQVPDLELGFTAIDFEENKFVRNPINGVIDSFILSGGIPQDCKNELLCEKNFNTLVETRKFFSISDVERTYQEFPDSTFAKQFYESGIKSAIFAPIIKNKKLLGIIELVSRKKMLNSINATKMEIVMPYLEDTMDRLYDDIETRIQAIIQREYTSIHPSVYWKFRQEAERHIGFYREEFDLPYRKITFENLTPLFGQTDIRNSSVSRNLAIKKDLEINLMMISEVFKKLSSDNDLEEINQKLVQYQNLLNNDLKADTESQVQNFIHQEVHPLLESIKLQNVNYNQIVTDYHKQLDSKTELVYNFRKKFDDSLSSINKTLADILDKRQEEQQRRFPFYYERFKTDGVEHNMYIGASIEPDLTYDPIFLKNLRLWQLRVLCETEIKYNIYRETLDYSLDVSSLILVYSTPISIRFRMDEKRFDVDGSYNARYEMIKKRIDKSLVKNSHERITQPGKISIIFSQDREREEYLKLIKILQDQNVLSTIEELEVEDLQGINGLRALRVAVNYDAKNVEYDFVEVL
ncbi:GAF domain-containing protein [Epilithonimonas vandammei]|uniref:GAF domain-containing protein n=1 Tax=Epilithonimonas vandammei TaxID=2487072 RepID=A0A3G8ZLS6_9FLAO|nr:GAF domain-containing protein [Epilithonimonas vandammei]AZI55434.1 GAF domain-containing protein [Epilithonimonas vandammei]